MKSGNIDYIRVSTLSMSRINTENLTKLYYSIGEVAEMFDVKTSLIRFWEKEFTQLKPKKNKKTVSKLLKLSGRILIRFFTDFGSILEPWQPKKYFLCALLALPALQGSLEA